MKWRNMPRSSPTTLTLPPFEGTVRRLILANLATFFAIAIFAWLAPATTAAVVSHLILQPLSVVKGEIWQLATYSFVEVSILSILGSMLSLWFCGPILEGAYGSRFLGELYFTSAIGGALAASVVSFASILHFGPQDTAGGAFAGIFGILIAIAVRFGDLEFMLFPLPVRIRAKYLVAIYILIDLAVLLKSGNTFGALLELSGAFCGFLYVSFAPRRGLSFAFSERYFSLRNAFYRNKRRRAARKFEVYMGKQGRKVQFDKEGRYIDPDEHKDPNDKRWMN
jgi:membrane associated rhomboid family serine protease